jgi:aspartate/glutamate racemase
MDRNWTPSIVPTDHDQTIYLVVNNFRHLGTAFTETDVEQADLETVIIDLMSGQYSNPVRALAFNTAEHWADDVSQDVALEIQHCLDLTCDELPSSIEAFIETLAGTSRQLSLRLN